MKIRYCFLIFAGLVAEVCRAQSFDDVLRSVMTNSLEMRAESASVEADVAEHKVGLSLDNPEVEFGYLWGSPTDIGSRKDISVTQRLDAATIFGLRRKVANAQSELAITELEAKRLVYMLETSRVLLNVTYYNRLLELQHERLANARSLADIYAKALADGEVNKIEAGKALLELADAESEIETMELERQTLLLDLKMRNGGHKVEYGSTVYPSGFSFSSIAGEMGDGTSIRSVYDSRSKQMLQLAQKERAVAKSNGLPEVSVGYMAELTRDEKFRGVTVGVSIPLWANSKAVRHAKVREISVRSQIADDSLKLRMQIEGLHIKVGRLNAVYSGLQKKLDAVPNAILLRKALDAGELSLMEYLSELKAYFDLKAKLLIAERDYYCALAELKCVE